MEIEEKKVKMFEKALRAIEADNLLFLSDVWARLGITAPTFYRYFPKESEAYAQIAEKLEANKIDTKIAIRKKFYQMDNPTTLIALYKLIATDDERRALGKFSQTRQDAPQIEGVGKATQTVEVSVYEERIIVMLKTANRYSEALMPEITAMAMDMALLETAKKEIELLPSPFIKEETTQGTKLVLHPAYALQNKASENIAKHSKLLGLDYENAPASSYESPLEQLTKMLIDTGKPVAMTVKKQITRKKKK